ncbi:exported murein endopeptidase [Sorangium cellulosum]|uniref:Exported murein endopeptidase n=1 Tax=Sorangium cellulosum TaxID=56 RepID=A0A2L0F9R1_SORCE|nr:penicillin-insensitive murein endopeptidase [Sorangium cellulosum]AUX48304.1 exported murein endopeptidase [Sorangium cellulosum]
MPLLRAFRDRLLASRAPVAAALLVALSAAAPAQGAPPSKAPDQAEQLGKSPQDSRRGARQSSAAANDAGPAARSAGVRAKTSQDQRPSKKRAANRVESTRAERGGTAAEADERKPLSKGAPNRGRLTGAVRLRSSRHLKTRDGARTWGLPVLVKALRRAAFQVAKRHGDSALLVGDLSARTGGALDGHNSHQTGRDADVGFYVVNSKGKTLRTARFVAFDDKGNAIGLPGARFDDMRNWALVEALLQDRQAGVKYLFVTDALKARLLAHAAKKRVPEELRARAAAAMMSPRDADLHNDHFHIRVMCPASMRGACVEESAARPACAAGATGTASAASPPAGAPEAAAHASTVDDGAPAAAAPATRPTAPR